MALHKSPIRRIVALSAVAALALAAPVVAETSSAASTDSGASTPIDSAAARRTHAHLNDVALVPHSNQAWAVGYWERSPGDERPLAYHWTHGGWYQTPVPNARLGAYLEDVVATSPRNAWAVGSYYQSKYDHRPYAVHWNGKRWQRVPAPKLFGSLHGISAARGGKPWAVGDAGQNLGGQPVDTTLIVRWTGRAWKRVASPGLGYAFNDIDVVSSRNAWAVGNNDNRTLAARWNGRSWHRVRMPSPHNPTLEGVAALRTQVWAVGHSAVSFAAPSRALVLRWSAGRGWKRMQLPRLGASSVLNGVAATSARNVWAVGDYQAPSGDSRPVALHWNGRGWRASALPGPTGQVRLEGVASSGPGRTFTVGYNWFHYDPAYYAYLAIWNGRLWRWWHS